MGAREMREMGMLCRVEEWWLHSSSQEFHSQHMKWEVPMRHRDGDIKQEVQFTSLVFREEAGGWAWRCDPGSHRHVGCTGDDRGQALQEKSSIYAVRRNKERTEEPLDLPPEPEAWREGGS